MNIKEAKQEIIHTLQAYHKKDAQGNYTYPLTRQRPILLMGPPGIGKTAIMEQIAQECGVGLVAYTITHHTRQSAVGLPKIVSCSYDGTQMDVTRYTMSEIIASVYDCMKRTGKKEGILFIDEINCVSETLAPTMLQFLQNKTFGSHKVPDGWMIVAAGNPSRYNKSVREFDIVTLDRVRKIEVDADLDSWMEYAWNNQVHGAVLSYLRVKKDSFYLVENTSDGIFFVTARGWEDLSELLKSYEELQIPITKDLVIQFLQKEEIARDFAAYYQLYKKYGTDYGIADMICGKLKQADYENKVSMAKNGSFEERFTVTGLLTEALNSAVAVYEKADRQAVDLHEILIHFRTYLQDKESMECLSEFLKEQRKSLEIKKKAELLSPAKCAEKEKILDILQQYGQKLKEAHMQDKTEGFARMKMMFQECINDRRGTIREVKEMLSNAFQFMEEAFGDGQEMVLFVTNLTGNERISSFIAAHGCEAYFRYSENLNFRKTEQQLAAACREILEL